MTTSTIISYRPLVTGSARIASAGSSTVKAGRRTLKMIIARACKDVSMRDAGR
jgi:hypothetical protein